MFTMESSVIYHYNNAVAVYSCLNQCIRQTNQPRRQSLEPLWLKKFLKSSNFYHCKCYSAKVHVAVGGGDNEHHPEYGGHVRKSQLKGFSGALEGRAVRLKQKKKAQGSSLFVSHGNRTSI